MGPLHGLMKEHSRALVMVIGDCMRTKKVGDYSRRPWWDGNCMDCVH